MRIRLMIPFAGALMLMVLAQAATAKPFEFFPLDNGVGRGSWTPKQQAECVKELGFDGIGYNYTKPADLAAWLKELGPRGMKLYSLYFPVSLEKDDPYPAGLREAIGMLKGSGTRLWITVPKPKGQGDWDAVAARRIGDLAALADEAGLRVVIYPHVGNHVAVAEDALRVLKGVKATNAGVTVNLCHELAGGNGKRIQEIIRMAAPLLALVTINGATDVEEKGWANRIQTLDKGEYDVYGMLKTLKGVGYTGPVGLQCFSIPGDPKENLTKSMGAWKAYSKRLEGEDK